MCFQWNWKVTFSEDEVHDGGLVELGDDEDGGRCPLSCRHGHQQCPGNNNGEQSWQRCHEEHCRDHCDGNGKKWRSRFGQCHQWVWLWHQVWHSAWKGGHDLKDLNYHDNWFDDDDHVYWILIKMIGCRQFLVAPWALGLPLALSGAVRIHWWRFASSSSSSSSSTLSKSPG